LWFNPLSGAGKPVVVESDNVVQTDKFQRLWYRLNEVYGWRAQRGVPQ